MGVEIFQFFYENCFSNSPQCTYDISICSFVIVRWLDFEKQEKMQHTESSEYILKFEKAYIYCLKLLLNSKCLLQFDLN